MSQSAPSRVTERDQQLFDDYDISDVLLHARKLQGLIPYSMTEVKPRKSAAVIYAMVEKYRRLRDSGAYKKVAALEKENASLRKELKRLWRMELEYKAMREARRELPHSLDAPA